MSAASIIVHSFAIVLPLLTIILIGMSIMTIINSKQFLKMITPRIDKDDD
jgi:hypothetical protein